MTVKNGLVMNNLRPATRRSFTRSLYVKHCCRFSLVSDIYGSVTSSQNSHFRWLNNTLLAPLSIELAKQVCCASLPADTGAVNLNGRHEGALQRSLVHIDIREFVLLHMPARNSHQSAIK